MLQKFMDEVRDGKREGSTVSSHSVDSLSLDEREAWRLLRKELEDVGITPHLFEQHKDWIRKTIEQAVNSGALQEQSPLSEELHDDSSSSMTASITKTNKPVLRKTTRTAKILRAIFPRKKEFFKAVETGNVDLPQSLLKGGSDVEARDTTGRAAIILASTEGHEQVVKLLLDTGADFKRVNFDGENALMWASKNGHEQVVKLLLDAEVDFQTLDDSGRSALEWASIRGNENIVRLLRDAGAAL